LSAEEEEERFAHPPPPCSFVVPCTLLRVDGREEQGAVKGGATRRRSVARSAYATPARACSRACSCATQPHALCPSYCLMRACPAHCTRAALLPVPVGARWSTDIPGSGGSGGGASEEGGLVGARPTASHPRLLETARRALLRHTPFLPAGVAAGQARDDRDLRVEPPVAALIAVARIHPGHLLLKGVAAIIDIHTMIQVGSALVGLAARQDGGYGLGFEHGRKRAGGRKAVGAPERRQVRDGSCTSRPCRPSVCAPVHAPCALTRTCMHTHARMAMGMAQRDYRPCWSLRPSCAEALANSQTPYQSWA
jgi:hypothetical protein